MIIELKRYGDFDIEYTHSVWDNPTINYFDVSVLGDFGKDRSPDRAIRALKEHGFKIIKTKSLTIGGEL